MTQPAFDAPVSGPSYSRAMRLVGAIALVAIVLYGLRWWNVVAAAGWSSPAALMFIAAFFGMAGSYYFMLRAVTVIDESGIRQTGFVEKKVAWSDVRSARLARWGATRLIVRGERGPFTVFFGGSDELRGAFQRIATSSRK